MRDRLIKLLDGADLFLRNRANAEPAPLNEYDIEQLKDIAKVCDEAARTLERAIVPPCRVGDMVYVVYKGGEYYWQAEVLAVWIRLDKVETDTTVTVKFKDETIDTIHSEEIYITKEEAEQALSKLQASYEQVKEGVQE